MEPRSCDQKNDGRDHAASACIHWQQGLATICSRQRSGNICTHLLDGSSQVSSASAGHHLVQVVQCPPRLPLSRTEPRVTTPEAGGPPRPYRSQSLQLLLFGPFAAVQAVMDPDQLEMERISLVGDEDFLERHGGVAATRFHPIG